MRLPAASCGVSKRNSPKFSFLQQAAGYSTKANKYLHLVIPAKAGIQINSWMPDQFRHDGILEAVSKPQIAPKDKARADEKAEQPWEYVSISRRLATQ